MRSLCLTALAFICACSAPAEAPAPDTIDAAAASVPIAPVADDGSYLSQIDPLGGQWRLERIGDEDFARYQAWVNFSEGGFLNHGAGCSGGFPAFYRLEGQRISVTRLEAVRTGLCAAAPAGRRPAAVASERRLAAFIDQISGWSRPDPRTLILAGANGERAVLTRPTEPNPDIAGRWLIERIGGEPLVTEQRPATLSIGMGNIGAYADCNSMGSPFTTPAPGRLQVEGPVMSTAIGCAPEDQAEDELMARAITSATAYRVEGDRLFLTGGPGLAARRPPPPDRRLVGEYEACGNTMLGAYHEGPITLGIDLRRMRDNAGCAAEYSADGPHLSLRLETSAACADRAAPFIPGEPVGIGGEISLLAVAPPDAFGFNEQGQLILRTPRGLLTMCRKGSPPLFGD
ncbi:META domain-containing protein [Brevundimonas sp. 2R-24]|uniref:META domain-containing protein n=1 Tax=Peiella sedimenti TaxID=3061083 RepID=A0ABT8SNZ5_9CAUL|nr:META domain-containing protein [Caulobacteraceae bacterium XZ-24]